MEKKKTAPWKLAGLIGLAIVPVAVVALTSRSPAERPLSAAPAIAAAAPCPVLPQNFTPLLAIAQDVSGMPGLPVLAVTPDMFDKESAAKAVNLEPDFLADMQNNGSTSDGIPWVRMMVGVLAVAMLIGVGVWMMKKANGGASFRRDRHMKVLETRSLGRKAQLHLVSVGGRALLLTTSGENVRKLAEFSEDDLRQENETSMEGSTTGNLTFKTLVKNMVESCGIGSLRGRQ